MPPETGYTRQVGTAAAAPLPSTSADAFGAGVARTVQQAAGVLENERIEDYQIERKVTGNKEWAQFQKGFGAARENISGISREARKSDEPGHAERMGTVWEAQRETLLNSITDDSVRQRAALAFDAYGTRFRDSEAAYEEVRAAEISVENMQESIDTSANRVRRMDSADEYSAEQLIQYDAIAGMDLSDKQKEALREETDNKLAVAFLSGRVDADPELAKGLLAEGVFDSILTPQQVEQLRNGADVEIRREAARKEHEANVAKAAFRQKIASVKELHGQGVDQTDALGPLIEEAAALGLTQDALVLDGIRAEAGFAKVWGNGNATPAQRSARIAQLAGLAKPTADQQRELKYLRDNAGSMDGAFNSDKTAALIQQGGAPPVDFDNPATLRDRAAWARAQSAAGNGRVPLFTKAEIGPLQELMVDAAGEDRVLRILDSVDGGYDRAQAARQLAPNDPVFQQMAQLQPQVRATVRQGQMAVKNNGKFFKPDDPDAVERLAEMDRQITFALREIDQQFVAGVRDNARFYLAGVLTANGQQDAALLGEDAGDRAVRNAIAVALGGERRNGRLVGGLGTWGDAAFVLPETMDDRDFGTAVTREIVRSPNPPVNPDGSKVNLRRIRPVYLGGNRYGWVSNTGTVVRAKDGTRYISEIGR